MAYSRRSLLAPVVGLLLLNCLAVHHKSEALGQIVTDLKVRRLRADEVWAVCRRPDYYKILSKFVAGYYQSIELNWFNSVLVSDLSNKRLVALNEEYSGKVETEMKVNLPAADIWNVFRSKDFGHLIRKLMPDYYKQIEYVTGDGRVGTVLNVTLQPESAAGSTNWPGSLNWLEKIINIDDKTMTRRVRQLQGYHLDNGLTQFETVHRTIPKAGSSCVIKTVAPFKVKSAFSSFASATNVPSRTTARKIANYVNSTKIKG